MTETTTESNDSDRGTTYELFIGALSVLSLINLFFYWVFPETSFAQVALIMDAFMSMIFLLDFTQRFLTADSKSGYFFRGFGWMDLLSSLPLPQFKILRVFRILRVARLIRKYGAKRLVREFIDDRANSALLTLGFLIILVLEFGGYLMYRVERDAPGANITTAGDAIWYTFVTITTVGYGDKYPVTAAGRLVGAGIMMAGVALFGALAGYLANAFLAPRKPAPVEESPSPELDPVGARMAELKDLAEASRKAQEALDAKLAELGTMLERPAAAVATAAPEPAAG